MDDPVLCPSQLRAGEAQRIAKEQQEERECRSEEWTKEPPAPRGTHMEVHAEARGVWRLTDHD